jgi:hypothetical protein
MGRQTGNVDWKKNGKRAAIVAALTILLIGAGMFAGTKAKIFGDDALLSAGRFNKMMSILALINLKLMVEYITWYADK